jgi:HD-like signal output (HDOD) protein
MSSNIIEIIEDSIDKIPPLPDSVIRINKVANDEDSSLADLAKEIKKDPIASARILTEARSAYYGFKNITTIEKAVSQFGRATSKAIAIDSIAKSSFNIDISPYGISNADFLSISQKRSFLMMKWFSRVDFKSLKLLALSSLIGNIGQVLLADIIKKLQKTEDFKVSLSTIMDVQVCEEEVLGISSIDATCMILKKWGFDENIIDIIKKSKTTYIEDNDNIDKLVLANFIVYEIVDSINANKLYNIPEDIKYIMNNNNLNLDLLQSAVEQIKG